MFFLDIRSIAFGSSGGWNRRKDKLKRSEDDKTGRDEDTALGKTTEEEEISEDDNEDDRKDSEMRAKELRILIVRMECFFK